MSRFRPNSAARRGLRWKFLRRSAMMLVLMVGLVGNGSVLVHAATPPPSPAVAAPGLWQPLGPTQITYSAGAGPYNGRVTALAVDPKDSKSVYVGTPGGVFSTHDTGSTWASATPGAASPGAVSALAVDGSGRVYAGTGRQFAETFVGQPGTGIWFSGGGVTWSQARSVDYYTGKSEFAGKTIYSLIWDRNSPRTSRSEQHLLAGADGGIYESGDGGDTWTNVKPGQRGWAVIQDPDHPKKYWEAETNDCIGAIATQDQSQQDSSWHTVEGFNSAAREAGGGVMPMRIALTVTQHDDAWAAVSGCDGDGLAGGWLFTNSNGGDPGQWHQHNGNPDPFTGGLPNHDSRVAGGGGAFANVMASDPTQACDSLVMGVLMYKVNGFNCPRGDSVDLVQQSPVHVDAHAMVYGGVQGRFYVGTDGGLYRSDDSGSTWRSLNGFGTPQSPGASLTFGGGYDDTTGVAVAAVQDNGFLSLNQQNSSAVSTFPDADDSFAATIDSKNQTAYFQHYYASVYRAGLQQIGQGSTDVSPCPGAGGVSVCMNEPTLFTAPLTAAPSTAGNQGSIFIGSDRLRYSNNRGGSWLADTIISSLPGGVNSDCYSVGNNTVQTAGSSDCFSALALDPASSTSSRPIVLAGTDLGRVLLRTPGGMLDVTDCIISGSKTPCLPGPGDKKTAGMPWITAVAVRTASTGAVEGWVAFGKTTSPGRIWHSPDLNAPNRTWSSIDAAPSLPGEAQGMVVHALALDPKVQDRLYAGTDFGVITCQGCIGSVVVPTWFLTGQGLPPVAITRLQLSSAGNRLLAFTHGRGVWSLFLGPAPLSVSPPSIDFGKVPSGSTVRSAIIAVDNTGSFNVSPHLNLVGDSAFSITNDACDGVTLSPNSGCTFTVDFHAIAPGTRNATIVSTPAQLVPLSISGVSAGGWRMFHGDIRHNGQSDGLGPKSATVSWSYAPQDGYKAVTASPVVGWDGTVYLLRNKDQGIDPGSILEALSPSGTLIWSWTTTTESNFQSTPAVALDGTVYLVTDARNASVGRHLIAVVPGGASTRWERKDLDLQGSPTIGLDGTIYVQDASAALYAINPVDGSTKWSYNGGSGESSPALRGTPALSPDGQTIYGTAGAVLYALNLSGTELWWGLISDPGSGNIANVPAVGPDGTVYVATGGRAANTPSDIVAFAPGGAVKWRTTSNDSFDTTLAVTNGGLVVAGNDAGTVVAVHASDGSPAWTFQAPGPYGQSGFYQSSAAVARDGTIYIQNQFTIWALRSTDGSTVWSASSNYALGSPSLDSWGTLYSPTLKGIAAYR